MQAQTGTATKFHVTQSVSLSMTTPTAARVQRHRQALRAAGLRPVQIWVPDTRSASFAAECRRQCLSLAKDAAARADEVALQALLDQVADTDGWR